MAEVFLVSRGGAVACLASDVLGSVWSSLVPFSVLRFLLGERFATVTPFSPVLCSGETHVRCWFDSDLRITFRNLLSEFGELSFVFSRVGVRLVVAGVFTVVKTRFRRKTSGILRISIPTNQKTKEHLRDACSFSIMCIRNQRNDLWNSCIFELSLSLCRPTSPILTYAYPVPWNTGTMCRPIMRTPTSSSASSSSSSSS